MDDRVPVLEEEVASCALPSKCCTKGYHWKNGQKLLCPKAQRRFHRKHGKEIFQDPETNEVFWTTKAVDAE